MYTTDQLIKYLNLMVGQPYWYGTCCYKADTSLLSRKANQYPSWYKTDRMENLRNQCDSHHLVADCVGLIKGFFWTYGGRDVESYLKGGYYLENRYRLDCEDRSADGIITYFKSKGAKYGKMNTLPETICLVHKTGHVGVYIGNGKVVEAKGYTSGIIKSNLSDTAWVDWVLFPSSMLSYPCLAEPSVAEHSVEYTTVSGDNLWNIAKRFYGNGKKYPKIMEDNGLKSTLIKPGMKLTIKGVI